MKIEKAEHIKQLLLDNLERCRKQMEELQKEYDRLYQMSHEHYSN